MIDRSANSAAAGHLTSSGTSAVLTTPPGSVARSGPSAARKFINFTAFQGAWFACVLGAARGWWWAAPVAALAALAVHAALSPSRRAELGMLFRVVLLGLAIDVGLVLAGVVEMRHGSFGMMTTAAWFASLWACFATTLNSSMAWLTNLRRRRILVAALFGALGGPAAYMAGERLGAVTLPHASWSLAVLSAEWALLTPLVVLIAARCSPRYGRRSGSLPVTPEPVSARATEARG